MNTPWYDYLPDSSGRMFYFSSSGDKKIDKVLFFNYLHDPEVFEIVLGNLRTDGSVDVDGTGDQRDAAAVLSTVAKCIAFFLSDHPDAEIFIEGSTPARTRLYQMAIVRELKDLGQYFDIYGFTGNCQEIFQSGRNYRSFIISLKNN
ncbi:hypothetical protein SAMN04487996_112220 [Dyadobacter soli]|uniref:Uncharacterized protein n=1 Tax=Dyadobacter soli TaxID=659014 RepID=A0A1G7P2K3_9BACT|nr:hypothetical protein [Dyadobacter soli]SDF79660.1 hypothetical protein SAMN04487996_112220 [Dyadobacter soli]